MAAPDVIVSIVIPTLNAARFIEASLQSILSQSFHDFEVIVIDGGSEDDTVRLVEAVAQKDARIRIESRPGLGLYASIFAGIDMARGRYTGWIGADDRYPPWALALAVHHLSRPGTSWIMGQRGIWNRDGTLSLIYPSLPAPRWLIRAGAFNDQCLGSLQAESIFFKRRLLTELPSKTRAHIESLSLAGDHHLWKAFAEKTGLRIVPSVIGGFGLHDANRSVASRDLYRREVGAPLWLRWPNWLAAGVRQLLSPIAGYHLHKMAARANQDMNSVDTHPTG